jgi:hypothetical protein
MTPEQLQAIRARLDGGYDLSRLDMALLLDEVERLKAREESLVQQSVAQIGMIGRQAEWREGAYRRGAEKMREEIALLFNGGPNVAGLATMPAWRDFIRTLAIPEDKP